MFWNTVTPLLKNILLNLMSSEIFDPFRLVGGTSLSLQIGHRMSVDIDLVTDAAYDSLDFTQIDEYFRKNYHYVSTNAGLTLAPVNFLNAEEDFEPVCLFGKHWPIIKLDFVQWISDAK